MFDINFYMKTYGMCQELMEGSSFHKSFVFNEFEKYRKEYPVIYNIETTNACNMKCLPKDTPITLHNDDKKPIQSLNINDALKGYKEESGNISKTYVKETLSRMDEFGLLKFTLENGKVLRITKNHPVMSKRGWIEADKLTINDEVLIDDKE